MGYAKFIVVGFLAALANPPTKEPGDKDTHVVLRQRFKIPCAIDEKGADKIKEVRLFCSRDKGKTWKVHSQIPSERVVFFSIKAPEKGLYWFAVQLKRTDGSLEPKSMEALTPGLKVKVSLTWTEKDEENLRYWRQEKNKLSKGNPNFRDTADIVSDLEARKKAAQNR